MTKNQLNQYLNLKAEVDDIRRRMIMYKKEIESICAGRNKAVDTVKSTRKDGVASSIRISGISTSAYRAYDRAIARHEQLAADLAERQNAMAERVAAVEDYIARIDNTRIRRIFTYRYVEGLNWTQIGNRIGKHQHYTAESCRNSHDQYLEIKK